MYPEPIQKLINLFSRFPTVGSRTSARFVFYLLKAPQSEIDQLIAALQELKQQVALCRFCFNPFDKAESAASEQLCTVCRDKRRTSSLICIVEKESDLESLEKTKTYTGLYFILGGTLGMLKKADLKRTRMPDLKKRLEDASSYGVSESPKEVIIAINPTAEGEATALYIERMLQDMNIRVTRLGRGLPVGAEIEYADEETLRSALEGRR